MPKILLKFEAAVIKEIKLDKPAYTVGRKPDNDIQLDHPTVSSHHCKLYLSGSTWYVEDTNSTNGTYVNGKKVLKSGLHNGDSVAVVKYTLSFFEETEAEKAPKPAGDAPAAAAPAPEQRQKVRGFLEVKEGAADGRTEFELTNQSTYIGKSAQAAIPVKGSGIFGTAPDMAVVISMRPEGFYLTPLKEGYAKHNGDPLNEKVLLKDDDTIEVGGTKFRYFIKK